MQAAQRELKNRFVYFANELTHRFPDLDLRFVHKSGSSNVRFYAASVSSQVFELDLEDDSPQMLVNHASLEIKELAGLFDA